MSGFWNTIPDPNAVVPPVSPTERLVQLSGLQDGVSLRGRLAASTGTISDLTLVGTALADQVPPRNITTLRSPDHDATFIMQLATDAAESPNGTDFDVAADSAVWYVAFRTAAGSAITVASKRDPAGTNAGIRIQLDSGNRAFLVADFGGTTNLIGLATPLNDNAFHGIGVLVKRNTDRVYVADDFETIDRILTLSQPIAGGSLANTEPFRLGAGDTSTGAGTEYLFYAQWPNTGGQLDSWTEHELFDLMISMRSGAAPSGGLFTKNVDAGIV